MNANLIAFFIAFIAITMIYIVVAVIRQVLNNKKNNITISNCDTRKMNAELYSGKYSVCKNINEANAEF